MQRVYEEKEKMSWHRQQNFFVLVKTNALNPPDTPFVQNPRTLGSKEWLWKAQFCSLYMICTQLLALLGALAGLDF